MAMTISPRTMSFTFKDEVELKKSLAVLSEDVVSASITFRLHQDIMAKARDGYTAYMDHAPAFWSIALDSMINQALLLLGRVYDKETRALSLPTFLEAYRSHLTQSQARSIFGCPWTKWPVVQTLDLEVSADGRRRAKSLRIKRLRVRFLLGAPLITLTKRMFSRAD